MKKIGYIILLIALVLSSCDDNSLTEVRETKRKEQPLITLDFESLTSKKSLSVKEEKYATEIVYSAFKRADPYIKVKDGMYVLGIESGLDIRISEDLYSMIKGTIDDANKEIARIRSQGVECNAEDGTSLTSSENWKWTEIVKMYGNYK